MATGTAEPTPWAGPAVLPTHPAPDPARPAITILYASSTGTAADVAHRIAADLVRARFPLARCTSCDAYDPAALIDESHVLFVVATTGAGEFPASALSFWRFLLRDGLPADILSDLRTAVFGLGDSSYPRFCWPARKLTRRLHALGAQPLLPSPDDAKLIPEGDDQHPLGLEGALGPWLDALYSTLEKEFPPSAQYPHIADDILLPPRVRVRLRKGSSSFPSSSSSTSLPQQQPPPPPPFIPPGWHPATLVRNERVTAPGHFQDVRAIEWERTDGSAIEYMPGDVACILPENDPADIDRLLRRMGWTQHADTLVDLLPEADEPLPPYVPTQPITFRRLLTSYLSPLSVPRRSFFAFLRAFTPPSHLEHEKLTEFLTPGEGTDEMFEYAQRVRRTCLEVLEEFRGFVGIAPEWAVEMFGWMQERKFSIASAPAVSPRKIELAIAIVKYRTRLREPRRGICTAWLARLKPSPKASPDDDQPLTANTDSEASEATVFPFRIERGTMHLPRTSDQTTPLILVGPGTGVAPMRSLAHERLARLGWDVRALLSLSAEEERSGEDKETEKDGGGSGAGSRSLPNLQLFLGCRHSERDFLFGAEWERLARSTSASASFPAQEKGRLQYALAPSREKEDGSKVYVQDKIAEHGQLVWELLSQGGAYFYISGSSGKMPEAVREAVKRAVREHGQMDEAQAERYLDGLEAKGRWQEECWS
ncbi:NAPDH-dependent diflavin reductase [Tilletia horrida]|nr:NAPDH-dependent diflavin reductase [Tilletia horrida]